MNFHWIARSVVRHQLNPNFPFEDLRACRYRVIKGARFHLIVRQDHSIAIEQANEAKYFHRFDKVSIVHRVCDRINPANGRNANGPSPKNIAQSAASFCSCIVANRESE